MPLHFDRYDRFAEFTAHLERFAADYPDLVTLESIGKSHEGRDIWLVTATQRATGAPADKPAFWIDANIHASEVAGSAACLYFLNLLTKEYGKRDDVTRCLDTRVFYICPRINPDGAEWALADVPKIVRSSTRPYPYDEEPVEGLDIGDVDGDGRILSMRIPDPNGAWKPHPEAPRLMVPREPTEVGGTYYRMLPEGAVRNYDGITIKVNKDKQGLDLNRNFPAGWRQEFEQLGAGPYPASEPEVRAVVDFIAKHPNIGSGLSFHTWSGVLLRPFSTMADDEMPPEDLWTYKKVGERGTQITGYPNISVFHEFRYHPKDVISGTFDWIYEHMGLFEWTVEIWCPMREAGVTGYKYIDWFREHPVDDDLKILAWADRELDGNGYVDWYPFDHPQLGRVELGGWNKIYAFRNPPPKFLERELAKFPDWLLHQCLILPRLELVETNVERLAESTWKIRVAVQNSGWLPSYVTKRALQRKLTRGVVAEIALPVGAALVSGKERELLGELEGRAFKQSLMSFWTDTTPTADRTKVEWVVKAEPGSEIAATLHHERAGVVRVRLTLAAPE